MATPRSITLALSNLGDERCGVGNTVAALLSHLPDLEVHVIDTTRPGARRFFAEARTAARESDGAVFVYPTRDSSLRIATLGRLVLTRLAFRRSFVRLYLHEFSRLWWRHKLGVAIGLPLVTDRIVVCLETERRALRGAARGLLVRKVAIEVAPTVNGTAPTRAEAEAALAEAARKPDRRRRTAGVFGSYRPDKGPDWLISALDRLEPRFDRLEFAGSGWDQLELPASVEQRFSITHLGHVPSDDLAQVFGRWGAGIAPFWEGGTHDGRGSLRTPLAFGVPTVARPPVPGDLTLDVPHLVLDDGGPIEVPDLPEDALRAAVDAVDAFERAAIRRAALALFDVEPAAG